MSRQFYFKLFSLVKNVKWFQVLPCITNSSIKHLSFIYTQLHVKIVLFQAIQFRVSTEFSSIWPINKTLSGASTPEQSKPRSNGSEGVLRVPQSSGIAGNSPSDCLVSYIRTLVEGVLPLCRDAVSIFYNWAIWFCLRKNILSIL